MRSRCSLATAGRILLLGFLGYYLASFLDFAGLAYITATLERLILYLNPTIVLLIGFFVFKRPATPRQLSALVISYAGVALALAHDASIGGSNIVLGSTLVFLSALSYALYLFGSGEIVARVGAMRLTAYAEHGRLRALHRPVPDSARAWHLHWPCRSRSGGFHCSTARCARWCRCSP